MLNIVLVNPEIPFNTGNIGRSCVATGTMLHLVGKLGFKIESKEIRRSGLDYWPNLNYRRYADWEEFLAVNHPQVIGMPALKITATWFSGRSPADCRKTFTPATKTACILSP